MTNRIYFYAYYGHNISMVEKGKVNPIENTRANVKDQNGLLSTSDFKTRHSENLPLHPRKARGASAYLSRSLFGPGYLVDEMLAIQVRYKEALFFHKTAAYLLGLTDRTPLFYSVTVPSGYSANSLKASGVKVYFVNRELY
jgi:hypothetical protein